MNNRYTTVLLFAIMMAAALLLFNLNGCTIPNPGKASSNGTSEQTSQESLPVEGGQGQGRVPRIQGNKPQGAQPIPTRNITNNDPSRTCDDVWIREGGPRDIHNDAITSGDNRMGPNVWGNSRDTALLDITRGLCLSRTLLHDTEGLLRVGYDFWEPEDVRAQHVNEIGYTTYAERAAWSTRVATAIHWLKVRFVRIQPVSNTESWYYGDKAVDVPPLLKGEKNRASVIFIITQLEGGVEEGIDFECIQGSRITVRHHL